MFIRKSKLVLRKRNKSQHTSQGSLILKGHSKVNKSKLFGDKSKSIHQVKLYCKKPRQKSSMGTVIEGKKKLKQFFRETTDFKRSLHIHRQFVNNILSHKEEDKKRIYNHYVSKEFSPSRKKSKSVHISINNFSLIHKDVEFCLNKAAKKKELRKEIKIKEFQHPFENYIKRMSKKKQFSNFYTKVRRLNNQQKQQRNYKENIGFRMIGNVPQMILFQNFLISFINSQQHNKVIKIIKKEPELLNKTDEKNFLPLHHAIKNKSKETVKVLLSLKPRLNFINNIIVSPLIFAYRLKTIEIVRVN